MTITYVGSHTSTQFDAPTSIAEPTGVVAGDFIVAIVTGSGGITPSIAAPSGWVSFGAAGSSNVQKVQFFYKKATSSTVSANWEDTNVTTCTIAMAAYHGTNSLSLDVSGLYFGNGATTSSTTSLTATIAGALILFAGIGGNAGTPPSGMTERIDSSSSGYMADKLISPSGLVGDQVVTILSNVPNTLGLAQIYEVLPPAGNPFFMHNF